MNITFPLFDDEELKAVEECLNSKWVTQGPLTAKFENLIAQRHKVSFALATTSCTSALHLAMLSLDIKPGDEVIVPAFTWVTSAHSAEYVGAKVIFVDVDEHTYNINPELIESAITERTKAIVAVHLFGMAAEMEQISHLARKYNLKVIEDAACGLGTTYKDKPVGGLGDIGCFSFHPRKVITTGEGGMVTTNSTSHNDKINSYRNHGSTGLQKVFKDDPKPYHMSTFNNLGFNLRLSDIQAAVGIAQFKKLDNILSERKSLAIRYTELLKNVDEIITPKICDGHTYQSYVIRVANGKINLRNKIMDDLSNQGIQTRPGTHAVHRLGYYSKKYGLTQNDFPISAKCEDTSITLPIFPGMSDDDQNKVIQIIKYSLK